MSSSSGSSSSDDGLADKVVRSTHYVDFEFLGQIGVLDDFTRLTERVGIRRQFWNIGKRNVAYTNLTKEFLTSLTLVSSRRKTNWGIQFTILGETHSVPMETLRGWFYLEEPQTEYLGYISENQINQEDPLSNHQLRHGFWPYLTGSQLANVPRPDARVNLIPHPSLRTICRTLGCTVWARGESSLRPVHEEFSLLSTMLRPDEELQRPDLMLQMIRHWLKIPGTGKATGDIYMGSYVTRIAKKLRYNLSDMDDECPDATSIGLNQLKAWRWIKSPRNRPQILNWALDGGEVIRLPIQFPPIDPSVEATWLPPVPGAAAAQPAPAPAAAAQPAPAPAAARQPGQPPMLALPDPEQPHVAPDVDMEDAHPDPVAQPAQPPQAHPDPAQGSWFIPQGQWTEHCQRMHDTYEIVRQMQEMQRAQNELIHDMHTRSIRDGQRMDELSDIQRQQGQRMQEMHELMWTIRTFQLGGDPDGGSDPSDAAQ